MVARKPLCRDVTIDRDDIVRAANIITAKRANVFDQRDSDGKIAALRRKALN